MVLPTLALGEQRLSARGAIIFAVGILEGVNLSSRAAFAIASIIYVALRMVASALVVKMH
jgi:hypothetical protein